MPNITDVEAGALLAERALVRVAPGVAERLSACLPEIFGSPGKAAAAFKAAPADAELMERLGLSYGAKLSEAGLPKTATPHQLFAELRDQARAIDPTSPTGDKLLTAARRSTAASRAEIKFLDGTRLSQTVATGRTIKAHVTTYKSADDATAIGFNRTNSDNGLHQEWSYRTPAASGKEKVPSIDESKPYDFARSARAVREAS